MDELDVKDALLKLVERDGRRSLAMVTLKNGEVFLGRLVSVHLAARTALFVEQLDGDQVNGRVPERSVGFNDVTNLSAHRPK